MLARLVGEFGKHRLEVVARAVGARLEHVVEVDRPVAVPVLEGLGAGVGARRGPKRELEAGVVELVPRLIAVVDGLADEEVLVVPKPTGHLHGPVATLVGVVAEIKCAQSPLSSGKHSAFVAVLV